MLIESQALAREIKPFLSKLKTLDLAPIAFTLQRHGWTYQQITGAMGRYLLFLMLIYLYPNSKIVPTQEIDQVWHHHILDTSKYAEDCQMLFGHFVHHFPYFGYRDDADHQQWQTAFTETQQLFAQNFGAGLIEQSGQPESLHQPAGCVLRQGKEQRRPGITVQMELPPELIG